MKFKLGSLIIFLGWNNDCLLEPCLGIISDVNNSYLAVTWFDKEGTLEYDIEGFLEFLTKKNMKVVCK